MTDTNAGQREMTIGEFEEELKQAYSAVKAATKEVTDVVKGAPSAWKEAKSNQDALIEIITTEIKPFIPWFVPNVLVRKAIAGIISKLLKK